MSWENASGFGSKENTFLLSADLLAQVDNNYSGSQQSQTLYNGSGEPAGITIVVDYLTLPTTGVDVYSTYESDTTLEWNYGNWSQFGNAVGGVQIKVNNSVYVQSSASIYPSNAKVSAGFIVNHDTHKAKVSFIYQSSGRSTITVWYQSSAMAEALYNALMNNPYVQNVWHSVGSIAGKLGVFNLAGINDEDIGDGSYVSGADYSVIAGLSESARLNNIVANMSIGETRDICYSGDVFKMTGEFGSGWFKLYFYLRPTTPGTAPPVFYSYQFSTTAPRTTIYIGFIIDDDNEVAALNLISVVVDQQTGTKSVNYCYPGTSMTSEEMHLMWGWIKGSFSDNDALDSFVDNDGDGGGDLINRINNHIRLYNYITIYIFIYTMLV